VQGFRDTIKDRDVLAEADKLSLEMTPVSGETVHSLITEIYQTATPTSASKVAEIIKLSLTSR